MKLWKLARDKTWASFLLSSDAEHEKAWLIRVTINKCKDIRKSFWFKNIHFSADVAVPELNPMENDLLQIVLSLPKKYKEVVYLHYYEDYTIPEIAALLNKKPNTIYSLLHRARFMIKKGLEGEGYKNFFEIRFEPD